MGKAGICKIGDVVSNKNSPLTNKEILKKSNLKTTFSESNTTKESIPTNWFDMALGYE